MGQWTIIAGLLGTCLVVVWSGARAVKYGDLMAGKMGLSSMWIGLVLLAGLTSLPELVVSVAAQLVANRPGLVMSNVCGSNLFNLLIFALVDFHEGAGPVSDRLSTNLIKPALISVFVMGVTLVALLAPLISPSLGSIPIGWGASIAVIAAYVISTAKMKRSEEGDSEDEGEQAESGSALSLKQIVLRFACFAIVLLGGGTALIHFCDALIGVPLYFGPWTIQLEESLVGTIILAMVTSLPEVTVSVTAVRMGKIDMAIGNLLGSCIFNVMLLPVAHAVRPLDPFWSQSQGIYVFSLFMAMVLASLIALGIRKKKRGAFMRMGWEAIAVAILGIMTFVIIASLGVAPTP